MLHAFLKLKNNLFFYNELSISKDIAKELAKFGGEVLYFEKLVSIDKDVAKELAAFQGERIVFRWLRSIDKDVAKELVAFKGDSISFESVKSIDKDVAKVLGKTKNCIGLSGLSCLTSMDQDLARVWANSKYGWELNKLLSIDKDAADELPKSNHLVILELDGLTSITKGVAKALAKNKRSISLSGLTSIDLDVAKELGKLRHELRLNSLTSIDKDVAMALTYLGDGNFKDLDELPRLGPGDDIPEFCHKYWTDKGLVLNGLTSIDKNTAKVLGQFPGYLKLGGLDSIHASVAAELVKVVKRREFSLGITSINKNVAEELAKYQGEALNLNSCTSLNSDAAEELARYKGGLYLPKLKSIDAETAGKLANFKGMELDLGLTSIDADTAQALSRIDLGERCVFLNYLHGLDEEGFEVAYLKSSPCIILVNRGPKKFTYSRGVKTR